MKLIQKLITYNKKFKWETKAHDFLDVMKAHHCSSFFKEPVKEDFKRYHQEIKEPRDLTLIEIKLDHHEYSTLKDFVMDLSLVWSNAKKFYKAQSFFHNQADTMEILMTHLIKEEGVFDMFDLEKEKKAAPKENNTSDDCEFAIIISDSK
jgi:hypothetical protein